MGRSPSWDKNGLKKGPWTPEEDNKLVQYIQRHGHGSWRTLPKLAGLNRCGKSCRLRWTNYLRPDIKRGKFSPEEEQTILNLHSILGNKWSAIATHLPGRTDNEIKNFYNTHLKKKLIQMGLDPMTHRPRDDLLAALPHLLALAGLQSLSDGDQIVRMQAEAAKLNYLQCLLHSSAPTSSVPNNNSLSLLSQPMISNTLAYSTSTAITAPLSMENPCSFDQALSNGTGIAFSQGEGNGLSTTLVSPLPLPPLNDASAANSGDGCSKTRYGGSDTSFLCPELFVDEPFMIELA